MLIILSGPPAAGKSSVGQSLAKKFPKSAYFSVDTIRHFVKGGFVKPADDTVKIGQSKLAAEISKDIIRRYLQNGYVVIIDDVIGDKNLTEYQKEFPDVFGFLLFPSLEVLKQRDKLRSGTEEMDGRIDDLYKEFTSNKPSVFNLVDSSRKTLKETVEDIYKKVSN